MYVDISLQVCFYQFMFGDRDFCSRFTLIPRSKWSDVPSKCNTTKVPVDYFFVHVTDSKECNSVSQCSQYVRNIQHGHMTEPNEWCDIAYSFLIGGDGNVYEGTGWSYKGTHTKGYNSKSFAVSFMGKFEEHNPGENMLKAAQNLIACGVQTGKLKCDYQLKGHRDVSTKSCPNKMIYGLIQKWPRFYTQINDVVTAVSLIPSKIVEVKESFCDFEKDFCEWRQDIGSQFNWVRHKGFSDCAGKTGPTGDRHGNFTGFYILADASNNALKQTKLRSPNIPVPLGYPQICVTFYYMMFGKDMGTLQVRMFYNNGPDLIYSKILWEEKGSQTDKWMKMDMQPKGYFFGGTIYFEITAKIGNGYLSDIALDDISIKQGNC